MSNPNYNKNLSRARALPPTPPQYRKSGLGVGVCVARASASVQPKDPKLTHENGIVWLMPIDGLPYVRQKLVNVNFRSRQPGRRCYSGRLAGYATLDRSARSRNGRLLRRIFTVAPHDPYEGGGAPVEAVDPLTVAPGVAGRITERAWGGPLTTEGGAA